MEVDILVVGAGPVGCVVAERAATELGLHVLILDRRNHIAGNCYDRLHDSGVLIHQYGPHYFRTDSRDLIQYLSRFTKWIPGDYVVKVYCQGQYYPFPINLDTLEQFFHRKFTAEEAMAFLEEVREKIDKPETAEEFVLSQVGRALYENFYLGYTTKQWGMKPSQLAASVTKRVPVRFNRDHRYVNQKYQMMPEDGYTAMFKQMVDHPNISLMLETDYQQVKDKIVPRFATVYCGPLDEYFNYRLGPLPWRSLNFDFQVKPVELFQPCVQINYPNDFDYTRSFEVKHVTKQQTQNTVVGYEYPSATGEPYYPVPALENQRLLEGYQQLARAETEKNGVYFVGRLAQYRYINTDEAIEAALQMHEQIKTLVRG